MRNKKKRIAIICITLFVLLIFCAFYNGLVIREYVIKSDKIAQGETIRIVLISDLHSHIYGDNQSKLISKIKEQKPDIIALAGDIADDIEPIDGTEQFLEGIKGMAPTYYVTGNHEYWTNDIKGIKAKIRGYGVVILENTYEPIKIRNVGLIIGGVDDPMVERYEKLDFDWQKEFHNKFTELAKETDYKILLAHRPEFVELYKQSSFDLVLSGHAHGGQVRIPFVMNGVFAPDQGWFPKYAGGEYKHESLVHIVSRGISYNPRLPRIFNPPEIVVIKLAGK